MKLVKQRLSYWTTSLLTVVFLFSGCTYFVAKIDRPLGEVHTPIAPKESSSFCPIEAGNGLQLVGTNPGAQRAFTIFIRQLSKIEKITFTDKAVLWTLLQMNVRPDMVTPTSRLQFSYMKGQEWEYHDAFSEDASGQSYPMLKGLENWLKLRAGKSLETYALWLDQYFTQHISIGRSMAQSLSQMRAKLAQDKLLRQAYFRGQDILQESERLPKLRFRDIITFYRKQKSAPLSTSPQLFTYRQTPELQVKCNYDFTLYDNSIFLIDKTPNTGHIFGIADKNESFMAIASQKIDRPQALFGQPLFAGNSRVRSAAICGIHHGQQRVLAFSNNSRDPGQHLYHLFRYGLTEASSNNELAKLLSHSRHLFLSEPLRLIIESKRSTQAQVEQLLKLNVPLYNADSIGNIWALTSLPNTPTRFLIDDRNPGALHCPIPNL